MRVSEFTKATPTLVIPAFAGMTRVDLKLRDRNDV
jgi:hypothetical protein